MRMLFVPLHTMVAVSMHAAGAVVLPLTLLHVVLYISLGNITPAANTAVL